MFRRNFRKGCGIRGGSVLRAEGLGHIGGIFALAVLFSIRFFQRRKKVRAIHAAAPDNVGQDGAFLIAPLLSITGDIAGEDLVCLIGVSCFVILDGDGILLGSKGRNGQQHRHGQ